MERSRTEHAAALLAGIAAFTLVAACQTEVSMSGEERLAYGNTVPFDEDAEPYPLIMPSAISGTVVYEARCATCHAIEGARPDFADPDWNWQKTPTQLWGVVAEGTGGHPAFGDLIGQVEIWDSIGYVWSRNMGDDDALALSALTYGENCSVCHGKTGFGNGPLAHRLDPTPQNFTDRRIMADFTNEYMFFRISEGGQYDEIPESILQTMPKAEYHAQHWSAMPAWGGVLTPEQRRLIINHLRALTMKLKP